jgi:hypothetical protein
VQIYAPDGAIGRPVYTRAASPTVLAGLRIGVLDNAKPNARLLMERLGHQLGERTGASLRVVTDKGPGHNAATPARDDVLARLVEEVDLVITGSAD